MFENKTRPIWPHLILSCCLLAACGGTHQFDVTSSTLSTQDTSILPGPKGNRTPILPGSKGDRNSLASLELELSLPVETAFSLAQLTQQEAAGWYAEIDGVRPARMRLSRARAGGDGQLLSFVLEDVSLLPESALHELAVYDADGVLQSAGLMPLPDQATHLPEMLTSATLADWLIARKLQRGQPLQQLDPALLKQLRNSPEALALTEELKALYRQSKGKADPRKSAQADAKAEAAAQKQAKKPPEASATPSAKPETPKASSKPAQDKKPD